MVGLRVFRPSQGSPERKYRIDNATVESIDHHILDITHVFVQAVYHHGADNVGGLHDDP